MTKKIRTYKDLMNERENLELLLDAQEALFRIEIKEVEDNVFPVINMLNTVGKFATYNSKALLLTTASDIFIDLLADVIGVNKKNWVSRIIIPQAAKNFSSHFIANHKDEIISMFVSFINNLVDNKQDKVKEENCEKENKEEEIIN